MSRMPPRIRSILVAFALAAALPMHAAHSETDPVTTDPSSIDATHPPAMAEIKIPAGGTRMNGILYRAQGAGPHPLVILLHGFPGNERNLDLAQSLRRAGWHVLYFNYRGSWGSGGRFSFSNARKDVAAALAFVRTDATLKRFGIDASRIVLAGHSMGGWLALAGTADDAKVQCTVALAPWNVGHFGTLVEDAKARQAFIAEAASYTDSDAGPLRGVTPEELADEARSHARDWHFAALAPALAKRRGLVIASSRDESASPDMLREPLFTALAEAEAVNWESRVIDDDHGFSAHRIALSRSVVGWIEDNCR